MSPSEITPERICTCYWEQSGVFRACGLAGGFAVSPHDTHVALAAVRLYRDGLRARWISEEPLTADDIEYGHGLAARPGLLNETDPVWQATQPAPHVFPTDEEIKATWDRSEYSKIAPGQDWYVSLRAYRAGAAMVRDYLTSPVAKPVDPFEEWWAHAKNILLFITKEDAHLVWDAALTVRDR